MNTKNLALILILSLIAGGAIAQKPNITNAKVQERSAAAGLEPTITDITAKSAGPLWLGYRIPAKAKERTMCCWDSVRHENSNGKCCLGCRMDSEHGDNFTGTVSNCAPPEPVPYAFVFLKYEAAQLAKVRVFSQDCPLDFAGLPLYWLEAVNPDQSVAYLTGLAKSDNHEDSREGNRASKQSAMAIALHDVPAADSALRTLIQPGQPLRLREDVAFWAGVERGKSGLDLLRQTVKADSDERFREKATFAISQSTEHEALQDLIGMAHNDSSPRVRGQALFWLAQKAGRKEAGEISAAIENDPDTEVKKKAVFALSQIHDGEGVPLLINVAKTNKNPAVRKQAFFWLGQSNDPRALTFLEEVLTK
jgi:hypothetical protein